MMDPPTLARRLHPDRARSLLAIGLTRSVDLAGEDTALTIRKARGDRSGRKLSALADDLAALVLSLSSGALSFERLTTIAVEDRATLVGKSFLQAIFSPSTSPGALRALVDYADLLAQPAFPEATQLTGLVLGALGLGVLATRCGGALSAEEARTIKRVFRLLVAAKALPAELRAQIAQSGVDWAKVP